MDCVSANIAEERLYDILLPYRTLSPKKYTGNSKDEDEAIYKVTTRNIAHIIRRLSVKTNTTSIDASNISVMSFASIYDRHTGVSKELTIAVLVHTTSGTYKAVEVTVAQPEDWMDALSRKVDQKMELIFKEIQGIW